MEKKTLHQKLCAIQGVLKAPKGQYNSFGKYHYRSCEDILEALKPLIAEHGVTVTLSDTVELIGTRFYVVATASISDGTDTISARGFAREDETKKGMDGSQITGSTSSYARKYALNGLFAIDDVKDSDSTNRHEQQAQSVQKLAQWLNLADVKTEAHKAIAACKTSADVVAVWNKYDMLHTDAEFKNAVANVGNAFKAQENGNTKA